MEHTLRQLCGTLPLRIERGGASSMAQHMHANDETRHQPDDALTRLTADHRQVRALFQQYADTADPYLKQIIAEHVFAELTLHRLLEETVLYPAFAEQADAEGKRSRVRRLSCQYICSSWTSGVRRNLCV
jgi:hypothetical protein